MITDPRYARNRDRLERREEVDSIVAEWFAERPTTEIEDICNRHGVPVSPVNSIADIFEDPHYEAREMLVQVEHPTLGTLRLPGVTPKFSETPGEVRRPGPELGQHNAEIFAELGLSEADIAALTEKGII